MTALSDITPSGEATKIANPTIQWQPRCWKREEWPERDQKLWQAGCKSGTPFEPSGHGSGLRAPSLEKTVKGYGAWLSFLDYRGWLSIDESPASRATRTRLAAYFKAMESLGRAGHSIHGRFIELRMALRIMEPETDTSWILKPNGTTIRRMLQPHAKNVVVPDSIVLFDWGIALMATAKLDRPWRLGMVQYRDGLMIALFAARARRLRSMALLRLGYEFFKRAERYRIVLQPDQVKTKKYDAFDLPESLTPYVETYLTTVRPALLCGQRHDALWVGRDGDPLEAKGIQCMICKRSKARFGVAFGPHRFRHSIATTTALKASHIPGLAAPILGISKAVVETHYNRANQVAALFKFQMLIEDEA